MIGVGSAIRFVIERHGNTSGTEGYFFHALVWAFLISLIFIFAGIFLPDKLIALLGGDSSIIAVGRDYTRIFMIFSPFFMCNHICMAFVRNDGNPSVAMAATLFGSLFNIVFDYILMFPLGLGMQGAALATGCSPIVGILICCIHFKSSKCTITLKPVRLSVKRLLHSCHVGISSFVAELSSGVITIVFNMIILNIAGNTGVAAYGVIANTSLVAVSLFNGISQGSQPLISDSYGKGDLKNVMYLIKLAAATSLFISVLLITAVYLGAPSITAVFNSEKNPLLAQYAISGLRIYFTGFLFAGINIVGSSILSSVESAKFAFIVSIMRGFAAITFFAFLLSKIFGLTGIWSAFPAAEFLTMFVTVYGLFKIHRPA